MAGKVGVVGWPGVWTTRPAQAADQAAVADIDPGLYTGLDNLPYVFNRYITDPNRRAQVILYNGTVVGFQMALVTDDGETVVHQSSRLHPKFRSNGFWPAIRDQFTLMLRDIPGIQRDAVTSAVKTLHLNRIRLRKVNYNYVMERPATRVRLTEADRLKLCSNDRLDRLAPSNTLHTHQPISVVELSPRESLKVLECKENQWRLFPHGRIIISWEPYRLRTTNFKRIVKSCTDVTFVSREQGSVTGKHEVSSISFGHALKVSSGLRYDVEFYGNDVGDVTAHAKRHLQSCWDFYTGGVISFEFYTPQTLDTDKIRDIFKHKMGLTIDESRLVCHLFEGPYIGSKSKL